MNMILKSKPPKKYKQFNDYYFKENLKHRTNGILKFMGIDYKIKRLLSTELTNIGPKINRIDFAAEATDGENIISLIIECQTKLPTDDDIERFFQYVASLRVFKKKNVEL